ncbi:uncharacterized protein LOC118467678 [Anopheles albimanus]|uniref:uncharacterized protein LOC118467678 n=1 Tax=Anopheles albimanus TaxID=7167 RepID=UPI0016405744|nr:uncharacterized protein LOC118467678 [Anopheles albimanus]
MSFLVQYLKKSMQKRLERLDEDPRRQYKIIIAGLNFVGKIIGSDIMTPTYTSNNIILRLTLLNAFLFFWLDAYNMWINFGQLEDFIYCFETLLFTFLVSIKFQVFAFGYPQMQRLHQHILDFNERFFGDIEQTKLIANSTLNTFTIVLLFFVCCCCSLGLIFVFSLIWTIFVDTVVPFGFLLPGIGVDTAKGFVINYIFQMIESALTLCGIVASEGFFYIFLMNSCLQVDMLYTSKLSDLFEIHFFVVFGCIFCQLTSNVIVVLLVPDWYPGYFMFVVLTSQLLFNCALGEMYDSKCKDLSIAIYNVAWYAMDRRDQKALQLLLLASQYPVLISYGFGVVNIRAFFEIYRKTYSIGMMVLSVNEN